MRHANPALATLAFLVFAPVVPAQTEEARIWPVDGWFDDAFGSAVLIEGDTAVVGAPGDRSVYLFRDDGSAWVQEAKFGGSAFGLSFDLDDDTLVIGAPTSTSDGYAYVYERAGTTWSQVATLLPPDTSGGHFGQSVAIGSGRIAVSEPVGLGTVHVFEGGGTTWTEIARLSAADGALGSRMGDSLAMYGNLIAAGAPADDDAGQSAGAVYVFARSGTDWTQQAKLVPPVLEANDRFGESIQILDGKLLIGAPRFDGAATASGAVFIYGYDGSAWVQEDMLVQPDAEAEDYFGQSVSARGDVMVVGSYRDDDNGTASGSAYLFTQTDGSWSFTSKLLASDGSVFDQFGFDVYTDGLRALIGAPGDDFASGSAYVFSLDTGTPGYATCFGDGASTACPCGNDSALGARRGCVHSGGVGMTIRGQGSTSITADDLTLIAEDCPPDNGGVFYSGTDAPAGGAALFDGIQCAGGSVLRYAPQFHGTTATDTGFVSQDPSGTYFAAGMVLYFQFWTRDAAAGPSPCGTGANFSPAYRVVMTP